MSVSGEDGLGKAKIRRSQPRVFGDRAVRRDGARTSWHVQSVMGRAGCIVVLMIGMCGCSSERAIAPDDPLLPPAPDNGIQLVMPEMVIEPGTETMQCWYTTIPEGLDWIAAMQSFQSDGGHHVIGFTTDESYDEVPDGAVLDCIDPGAVSRYVPLLTPTLSEAEDDRVDLPEGLALHMRAGSRLVLQSHYINTSTETLRVRDVVNLWATENTADVQAAAPYMTQSIEHEIPSGGMHTLAYECPVASALNLHSVVGHMHEQGASMRILAGTAPTLQEIYRVDAWEDEYRDAPPMKSWPLEDPVALLAGDTLRVECTWDTGLALSTVTFPEEMCASLFWMYPLDEPLFCAGIE